MSWVIRVAKPGRIARGRRGSAHPVDLYHWRLWSHWPRRRRLAALAMNLPQAAMALTGLGQAGSLRQAARDLADALKWNVHPTELRVARESGVGGAAGALIGNYDKKGINLLLNPRAFPKRDSILFDKGRFAAFVAGQPGMTGIPTLALDDLAAGLPDWIQAAGELIFKPGFSSRGRGIFGLRRHGSGWVAERGEREEPVADLLAWARSTLGRGDVLQQRLSTHAALAPLSPGALPTLRLVTCVDEAGAVELVDATLRLGRGSAIVDNFSAGGLAAPVDLATGIAGPACSKRSRWRIGSHDAHPATGAQIAGFALPGWDEAKRQAMLGHRALLGEDFLLVGWDVALAADGPVLLEGNWNPGGNLLQTVSGRGIAATRLGELYRHHLARLPDARFRDARVLTFSR